MGDFLRKLGQWSFKRKWWVIASWLVILGILGFTASQFMTPTSSSISIPGTQAQNTLERFEELFPESGAQSGRIVVAAPEGKTLEAFQQQISTMATEVAKVSEVTAAITPFENAAALSKDKTIGYVTVQLKAEDSTVKESTIADVIAIIETTRTNGLTVEAGGDLVHKGIGEILGVGEISGVVVALIVLVITLGSLVAAGMPLIIALVTIGVSMAGLFSLSQLIVLTSTAPVLAVMLGLAVGIDYSLFIINRYRTYVKEGQHLKDAIGNAVATAGNAVLFAAATVVIALASLAVVQIPFMTTMGLAAASTVALAAIVAVTLIPALVGIVGMRIFGRKARKEIDAIQATHKVVAQKVDHSSVWYRIGETILKYRKTFLLAGLTLIVVLALPVTQLRLGLPTDEVAALDSSERKAYDLLEKGFGPGYNGPLLVVVEGLPATSDADKAAVREQIVAQYQAQLSSNPQAALMTPEMQQAAMAQLEVQVETYAPYYQLQLIAERIAKIEKVETAQAALTTDNGSKGVIQVIPTSGPSDNATKELVTYLRDATNQKTLAKSDNVTFGITGSTAIQIDINNKLADALPIYLAVVIGLSLLLLMVAFRSILIPLKATLGFLLSVFAMFGALVAVFQWGWFGITDAPGPIVSFIPIISIGILFGLAMDYEFFLVSSMQEAYHKKNDAKKAVLRGFALGSRVVVAAGLIMVAVFAGFIGNHDSTIQSMGFALATGILVDAFIVRMVIVPIVMSYLGKAAWWLPKWLEKRLPKISIEG